jgi:Cu(I)/Ag(I) efflux system membrane fusion protein
VILALLLSCGRAPEAPAATIHAGSAVVQGRFETDPPREGKNTVDLVITPAEPTPPTVEAVMPAMGAMAEMRSRAEVSPGSAPGEWVATFDLPMGGGWQLFVTTSSGRGAFALTTGSQGLVGESGGGAQGDGQIVVDGTRRQEFGIRTAKVVRQVLHRDVRALGQVRWDETRLVDVTLTTGGYVRELRVDQVGQTVKRGQTLFSVYDPALVAAEEELLLVHSRSGDAPALASARQKLIRFGLTPAQVDELAARGTAWEAVPILSPVSGYVAEKDVVEGQAFHAGDRLYRVVPLDHLWIEAAVYADDAALVHPGAAAEVTFPNLHRDPLDATVALVQPSVDPLAHTTTVRLDVANPDGTLLPGMYADVTFPVEIGEALVVPASAVLYTGPRRLVFVDLGEGRLAPKEVQIGARAEGVVEVRSGLEEGETVVASGTFLVAAESRIRSATDLFEPAGATPADGGSPDADQ